MVTIMSTFMKEIREKFGSCVYIQDHPLGAPNHINYCFRLCIKECLKTGDREFSTCIHLCEKPLLDSCGTHNYFSYPNNLPPNWAKNTRIGLD